MKPGVTRLRPTMALRVFIVFGAGVSVLLACATPPGPKTPEPEPASPVAETRETGGEPEVPAEEPRPAESAPREDFVVTEELRSKTFKEVELVISSLTRIIGERNYEEWMTYLSSEYVETTGSPEYLEKVSENAVLKKNGIVLRSLKDYFDNVVVRSRVEAKLEEISFVDATHVKAISVINGTPVILYWLVREEAKWKVGIWLDQNP